jgi:cytochrome P450
VCTGKNSFLWEGRTPKVIITEPEQIKQVFNKMHDFTKPKFSSIARFFAVGLASYEGEQWAKHRKIINPAFHIDKLKVRITITIYMSTH